MPSESPRHSDQPLGLGGGLFTLLLALLWAGTSVTAREAADLVPPLAIGAIRFALATLFMFAWCRWEGVSFRMQRSYWWPSFIMGWLLFLQIATFNWGVVWSNASHASLLVNTYIFMVAAYEHYITRTARLTRFQGLGLVVAAAGASLLLLDAIPSAPAAALATPLGAEETAPPRDQVTLAGDLMLCLSAVILAVKVLYTKHAVRSVPSGTLILWHDVIGTVLFIVASGLTETWPQGEWNTRIVLALLYNGLIVSGFCFAGHALMLRRHSASSISVYSFATPVFGVVLAVWLRGDLLSTWLLLSGVLVAIGIVAVNTPQKSHE